MTQIADSMMFRQKLYQNFKQSGLLSKLKTSLRVHLLQKLQKPFSIIDKKVEDVQIPFHLKQKFIQSSIAQYLKSNNKQYSLSIFMAECNMDEQDILTYQQLSQIINLGVKSNQKCFIYRVLQQFGRTKCQQAKQRATQTQFNEPLTKKLQMIDKQFKPKLDYWKLIDNKKASSPDIAKQQNLLRAQFAVQKQRLIKQMELKLKIQIQQKYQQQYNYRLSQTRRLHEGRLNQLKSRQKQVIDGLERKRKQLEQKVKTQREQQIKMINKYQKLKIDLQAQYRIRLKAIQQKQKQFNKKQLQLRAKKRQYQQSIRLVKQKIIQNSN